MRSDARKNNSQTIQINEQDSHKNNNNYGALALNTASKRTTDLQKTPRNDRFDIGAIG